MAANYTDVYCNRLRSLLDHAENTDQVWKALHRMQGTAIIDRAHGRLHITTTDMDALFKMFSDIFCPVYNNMVAREMGVSSGEEEITSQEV